LQPVSSIHSSRFRGVSRRGLEGAVRPLGGAWVDIAALHLS